MRMEAVSQPAHDTEKCPTCGGGVSRRSYGEMYAGSFIQNGKRVEIRRVPHEGFVDPIVLDIITQYFDGGLYRMWPGAPYYTRGGKTVHRDVWKMAFGDIPTGCHIHHKDSDPANNRLDNLECLPASEHMSITWNGTRAKRATNGYFTQAARDAATEWHKSEEGRLWHRRHARRSKGWLKWKREERSCPQCGKKFNALVRKSGAAQIYCHPNCKAAAYRARR